MSIETRASPHQCVIGNACCVPRPCANCLRIFCAHEHPECRAFGYYGQFCSDECQEVKYQQVLVLGQERFSSSRVVLVVEQDYCYLVLNKEHRHGFRILHEDANTLTDKIGLDYCHYPGFSTEEHPVVFAMKPKLQVALTVEDEQWRSMWTIVGFRLLDGEVDTFGVGGHIEVIDSRRESP